MSERPGREGAGVAGCQMRRYARHAASQAEVLMVSRKRDLCAKGEHARLCAGAV